MSIYINPDKIEEMAHALKRFNRDIEDMETYLHNMIQSFVNEVDAEYSESYVREVTREIRKEIYEARQLAAEITELQHSLALKAQNAASEYRYNANKQAQMIMQSTMSFILDMPLMSALKGIYRIISGTIRGRIEETPKFDPTKDYATLISDSIKEENYSNLQKYVNERDAKIGSDKDLYKDTQSTGEYLISLGYVSVENYLSDNQITCRNGKVYVTIDGKKYPLDIAGIALTGDTNYASKENIRLALEKLDALSDDLETNSHTNKNIEFPANFNLYSNNQKIQFYLHYLGFDIKTFSEDKIVNGIQFHEGDPLLDGDLGFQSGSALLIVQAYGKAKNKTVNGKSIEITGVDVSSETVDFLASIANEKSELKKFIEEEWKPEAPVIDKKKYKNGYVPESAFVKVYGNQLLLKEDAVAWAMLVNSAINYNKTETDETKKFNINTLKITMGYRDYSTQVYVELKEQLAKGNQASNPTWTNPEAAKKWISEHKNDWQTEYLSAIGPGEPLHGVGNSKHGWGLAIDFSTQDPGSGFYRILDKDQEYNGYVYKKGQIVGYKQTQGPEIDSLTAYNEFTGSKGDYGKGATQTPQVMWLEKNAKDFGFEPNDNKSNPILDDCVNYAETWHWNYNPSEV